MPLDLKELTRSLRFRLLASLFLLLGLSFAGSLTGIWIFERDSYTEITKAEAMRAARTVERSLRQSMLINDRTAIRRTVDDVQEIIRPSNISVLSLDGTVAFSGIRSLEGRRVSREQAAECIVCHERPGAMPHQDAVFIETENGTVLRNVIKVANAPECHGCHAPEQKNLGIVIYDAPFSAVLAMLETVLVRTVLTGLVSFILVVTVLSWIVQRSVLRPLNLLKEGFIHVGRGDFEHWVAIDSGGEIEDMADQFNIMNQAIKRSFAEIRRKTWETEQLYAFVQQLSQATEWHKLRRMMIDLLLATFSADRVALLLFHEKRGESITELAWRSSEDRRYHHREYRTAPPAGDLPEWVDADWRQWRQSSDTAAVFAESDSIARVPLFSHNTTLGLLCLHRRPDKPLSGVEKKLLTALCEQIEIALVNARLYRMAITDGLTGLYSKRFCESMVRKFLDAHQADQSQIFSVLMLDLDHFKLVNDTHGHQAGDEVLIQLADLLRAHVRHDDVACRFGGEEFIILVAGALDTALRIAERICAAVAAHPFECAEGLVLRNTISIGVAAFPQHGKTADEVIGAADQALYAAKKGGRNRVACYTGEE